MKYLLPILLLSTTASYAAQKCMPAEKAYSMLREQYNEKPFAELVDNQNNTLILFVSPGNGTWTVVYETEDNLCAVDAGKSFSPADEKKYEEKYKKKDPS